MTMLRDHKHGLLRKMTSFCLEDELRVLDMLPGVSCIANTESYLVAVSDSFCQVLGRTKDDILSHDIFYFIHPDDHERTKKVYADQAIGKDVPQFENHWRHSEGHYILFKWTASEAMPDGLIRAKAKV